MKNTRYADKVQQDSSGSVFVDVPAADSDNVTAFVGANHVRCSAADINPSDRRVVFESGVSRERAWTILKRLDELNGPGV